MELHQHIPCINCGQPIDDPKPPYLFCSELCRDTADYVRYHRRVVADGRIRREDVREAVRIQRAFVLGGGYPAKQRALSADQRAATFARDQRRCYKCGGPGNEIDHTFEHPDRDLNDPENLRVICSTCHRRKTIETALRPLSEIEDQAERERLLALSQDLNRRVSACEPVRLCDCERTWAARWRQIGVERVSGKFYGSPGTGPFLVSYDVGTRAWIVLVWRERGKLDAGNAVGQRVKEGEEIGRFRTWSEAMSAAEELRRGS